MELTDESSVGLAPAKVDASEWPHPAIAWLLCCLSPLPTALSPDSGC
jgi:hypothetical protein